MDSVLDDRRRALDGICRIVGPAGFIDHPEGIEPYLKEWRGLFRGRTDLVVRPATTAEVAGVVKAAAAAGIGIVPQGGNTGLVGGAVPDEGGGEIILSTDRLDRVRAVDALDYTITVEAGVILRKVQEAAAAVDRLFPLSLGAEGSCRIGGNLSTNAGGTGVLRYGNARDLVLGLEVVLPDGAVWDGLGALRKDNTGYDVKQLFIGAEGTLGIITAAVLKLFPRPQCIATAFAAVAGPAAAIELLALARAASGDAVTAFELMPRIGLDFALAHVAGTADPLALPHAWYVLVELSSPAADASLGDTLESLLAAAMGAGLVHDATIARSQAQSADLWRLREALVEAQRFEGGSIKNDISVPVSSIAVFVERALAAVSTAVPGIRPVCFGHVGDGNLHLNLSQPVGMDRQAFLDRWDELTHLVNDIATSLGGSISAEHGIGRLKRAELARTKSPVEMGLMRALKAALDPAGIMNPGKVL